MEPVVKEYDFNKNDVCRGCHGAGIRDTETCPTCGGTGIIHIRKEIKVTLSKITKKEIHNDTH